MNRLVSIVITNYNYANYISQAIQSVLSQDYAPLEIIVVDDGSTDDSVEIINQFGNKIRLIQKKNSGVSSARNTGLHAASGFYLAYLDADDFWKPTKIREQIKSLESSKSELVYCRMFILDESANVLTITQESRSGNFREIFQREPGKTPFPPSSVLMTTNLAHRVGNWDEALERAAEDYDYYRRCSLATDFRCISEPLVFHREHSESLTSGPLRSYYKDNQFAVVKLLIDKTSPMKLIEKKRVILQFQFSYFKAFVKNKDYYLASRLLLTLFGSIDRFIDFKL